MQNNKALKTTYSRLGALPFVLLAALLCGTGAAPGVLATDPSPFILTQDGLDKTLGALSDLSAKNIPIKIGGDSLDTEIANLQKQSKVKNILKNRGISPKEFVLTYKAAMQIRETEKSRDNWEKIIMDPAASPAVKLEATQKLGESLKNNLFTPEQMELVRSRVVEFETLLRVQK